MSAIVAGKSCKKCGKSYYLSLGHPKWYDDVIKRRMPKSDDFLVFEKICVSGMCMHCFIKENTEMLPDKGLWFLLEEVY